MKENSATERNEVLQGAQYDFKIGRFYFCLVSDCGEVSRRLPPTAIRSDFGNVADALRGHESGHPVLLASAPSIKTCMTPSPSQTLFKSFTYLILRQNKYIMHCDVSVPDLFAHRGDIISRTSHHWLHVLHGCCSNYLCHTRLLPSTPAS